MINLNKEEISLFLHKVKEDPKHFNKYLFYKLQYFYGRRSQEIAILKITDIDFDKREITFDLAKKKQDTKLTLVLSDDIAKEIKQQFEKTNSTDDYIFVENDSKIDGFKRNMRTFLERNSNKLIENLTGKNITLSTHDFRRLRVQHLYLEGNELEIIQSLYAHNSWTKLLNIYKLKK